MKGGKNLSKFETMYQEYANQIYRFLITLCRDEHIAEELTQETFYKAMKNYHLFKGDSKLSVWLCQIAKNEYFAYYNRQKKLDFSDITSDQPTTDLDVLQTLMHSEQKLKLHQLLRKLQEPYKEVITLKIFAELSYLEIASLFGKSESWARVTFYRGKNQLKTLMEGQSQ